MGRAGGGPGVSNTYEKNIEIGAAVDKLSEWVLALCTGLAGICAFIVKRIWGRIDNIENQMIILERNLITREDLAQIQDTQKLILQSLLEHRATEKTDVHE